MENRPGVVEMGHKIRSRENRLRGVAINQVKNDGAWVGVVEMRTVGGFWICFRRKANRACLWISCGE